MSKAASATASELDGARRGPGGVRRYPGVRSFEEQDCAKFFGRSRASRELLLRVLSVRLLLQFAPSGVGKTSLLNAGLFPALRQQDCFPFIVRLNERAESFVQAVARSLRRAAADAGLDRPLVPDEAKDLRSLIEGTQLWSPELSLLTPVVVFDQFEEVFTLRDSDFRGQVAAQIRELALPLESSSRSPAERSNGGARSIDYKMVISLREEYLGRLEEFSRSIPDLFHERLRLAALTGDEAREAMIEPAKLNGDGRWASPAFEFEPACLDALIDFIDGVSDQVRIIEPVTLQLVCQQAEALALRKAAAAERPVLTLRDFGGVAGLERLVRAHFANELGKLGGQRRQSKARRLFEYGLLDPTGKRLMLEEGEIARLYGVRGEMLERLVASSLLRREPRNESIFYEISHDRLAEAIAGNRSLRLPRWLLTAIAIGVGVIVLLAGFAYRLNLERKQAEDARQQAEKALRVLLGANLVSRLQEAGLADALARVLHDADIPADKPSLALVLSLRHQGDIETDRGTAQAARSLLEQALGVVERLASEGGENGRELSAERARIHDRLGWLALDRLTLAEAGGHLSQAIAAWDEVLSGGAGEQERLEAAETHMKLGSVQIARGEPVAAEAEYDAALQLSLPVLIASRERVERGEPDGWFWLGRAVKVYADGAVSRARVWSDAGDLKAALALARESLRLRPLSWNARIQVGVASAMYGGTMGYEGEPERALELFRETRRQFEELTQFDPFNRKLQRERAAVRLLVAQETAHCGATPKCSSQLEEGMLDEAMSAVLDSIGTFQHLSALDTENLSLKWDIAWGLQVEAKVARASGKAEQALELLDEARELPAEALVAEAVDNRLARIYVLHEKAETLVELNRSAEAVAALDQASRELSEFGAQVGVQLARGRTLQKKAEVLSVMARKAEAKSLQEESDRTLASLGAPWSQKSNQAAAAGTEALEHWRSGSKLEGDAAIAEFELAADGYAQAIAAHPFTAQYWTDRKTMLDWIETTLANRQPADQPALLARRESVLRSASSAAWLAWVIGGDDAPELRKSLYVARRSLAIFLRDAGRASEALTLAEHGLREVEELAQQPGEAAKMAELLADANAGIAMLRFESGRSGWEEAMRRALAYGEKRLKANPNSSAEQHWLGNFHRLLGHYLRQSQREDAARREYQLGLAGCREALRLAAPSEPSERDAAAACLRELADAGFE